MTGKGEIGPPVLIRRKGAAGIISLNRPRALHALNLAMVRAMSAALLEWARDPGVAVVIIDHAGDQGGDAKLSRGFCAGGDIAMLRQSALEDGGAAARDFFFEEYRLNDLLYAYPRPVVAFMDGITMGGGVGISQPARYRVATVNTRLAMPESGIGLFPDVGGGWYLSRLSGRLGPYLALTGARLTGADCLWAGLASHHLPVGALAQAKARLVDGEAPGRVLGNLCDQPEEAPVTSALIDILRHFSKPTLEAIIASLAADDSDWARATLATLRTKSPTTCKVALRQMADSLRLSSFAQNMAMEYRIAARVVMLPDFAEGVRAVILDKDNAPRWTPATPEGVTDEMIAAIFAPLPPEQEWSPYEL
jgi:enoyl-CoA hydratase